MRRRTGLMMMAGGFLAAALVWLVRPVGAQTAPASRPIRIAIVNLKEVSDTCQRTQDLKSALDKQRQAKVDAINALRDQLKRAQDDLKVLVKGTPAWEEQNARANELEVKVRIQSEVSMRELQDLNLKYTASIYDAILKQVEAVAKAQGIDLVLRVGQSEEEPATLQELYGRMAARSVLYSAAHLEITAEVRTAADRAYAAEKGGPR